MTTTLLHRGYFAPIDLFSAFYNADKLLWETQDNYQKQTYRNRQYIGGANGKLLLNIPIKHAAKKGAPQLCSQVEIDNKHRWQSTHWHSIESAYRTSPFFEFYEDELRPLYKREFTLLSQFNQACWDALCACFQIDKNESDTDAFQVQYAEDSGIEDRRSLIVAKRKPATDLAEYPQVFEEKHGFTPNLSILDLLFNEGPEALTYLSTHRF